MDKHTVNTVYKPGEGFTAEINGHRLTMDTTPPEGNDKGPSPKRLMLASLAGCTGIDIVSILGKMKAEYTDLQIEVSAELSESHPRTYTSVHVIYSIRMAEDDHAKMKKAVHLSQDKYCGVSAMFKGFSKLTWEVRFV